ncbi:hypothetical protein ACIA5D_36575 [Actinoplanes sp. NPDC051513]|uniref:hypothetical protein n=1 Tax=Actinoplanes sp. NPDC051513 TaxID=3363908 RepID=UPI0037ABB818
MTLSTTDLVLIAAADRGEFTYDDSLTYGVLWRGAEAEYDLHARVNNLSCDGYLVAIDDGPGVSPVTVTDAGYAELRKAGVQ